MAVCRGGGSSRWDALGVDDPRALDAPLSPIYGTSARLLAPAGSLGDAPIHGHVGQIETDHPIVGVQHHPPEPLHHPGVYPLVAFGQQGFELLPYRVDDVW